MRHKGVSGSNSVISAGAAKSLGLSIVCKVNNWGRVGYGRTASLARREGPRRSSLTRIEAGNQYCTCSAHVGVML